MCLCTNIFILLTFNKTIGTTTTNLWLFFVSRQTCFLFLWNHTKKWGVFVLCNWTYLMRWGFINSVLTDPRISLLLYSTRLSSPALKIIQTCNRSVKYTVHTVYGTRPDKTWSVTSCRTGNVIIYYVLLLLSCPAAASVIFQKTHVCTHAFIFKEELFVSSRTGPRHLREREREAAN